MRALLTILLIVPLTSPAWAKVIVGDKPQLKTRTMDGSTVDLATYAGKMILVDFFGKSDMSKRHEELVQDVYKKNADKGLVVIGICVERKPADAVELVRDLRLTWPVILEPEGFQGGLCKEWGLPMLPSTYLIGPDGDVLATALRNIDSNIATEMIKHPPVLVDPATVAAANSALDDVEKALADGEPSKAIRLFSRIPPEAAKNADFAKRFGDDRKKLSDVADEMITRADAAIDAKDYLQAARLLRDVGSMPAGFSQAATARQKRSSLVARPEVKEQLKSIEREAAAQTALEEARKLRDKGQDAAAYNKFKAIAVDYAATDAGADAAEAVKAYEADVEFMRHLKDDAIAAKANAALGLADSYRNAGRTAQARAKYQEVIEKFPGTRFAEQARDALDAMK